eukprot:scaffold31440_cov42-Phaeocystis_antarctica.AAC.2
MRRCDGPSEPSRRGCPGSRAEYVWSVSPVRAVAPRTRAHVPPATPPPARRHKPRRCPPIYKEI